MIELEQAIELLQDMPVKHPQQSQRRTEVIESLTALQQQIEKAERERERLLVLAAKHCDRCHHDFSEIKRIADG